jgi:hypothetical protein
MHDDELEMFEGFNVGFKTDKYMYCYTKDHEEDNIKIYHCCIDRVSKKRMHIPWSPYFYMTRGMFDAWVDMGMPSYYEIGGNITSEKQLEQLKERLFYKSLDGQLA